MRRRLEAEREDFGTGDADRQPAVGERGGGDERFCSAGGMIGGTGGLGAGLEAWAPELGVTAWQLLVWTIISTIVLHHGTFTINSLSHVFGSRRFQTSDTSRNNPLLAVITLGEGWHNNHHHYPMTARQGFYWWEYDLTWYGLVVLSWLGIVWDLRPVPAHVLQMRRVRR